MNVHVYGDQKGCERGCDTVRRLRGDDIECNHKRDIIQSLYEAATKLPACGTSGVLCGAIQEIQALRAEVEVLRETLTFLETKKEAEDLPEGSTVYILEPCLERLKQVERKAEWQRRAMDQVYTIASNLIDKHQTEQ